MHLFISCIHQLEHWLKRDPAKLKFMTFFSETGPGSFSRCALITPRQPRPKWLFAFISVQPKHGEGVHFPSPWISASQTLISWWKDPHSPCFSHGNKIFPVIFWFRTEYKSVCRVVIEVLLFFFDSWPGDLVLLRTARFRLLGDLMVVTCILWQCLMIRVFELCLDWLMHVCARHFIPCSRKEGCNARKNGHDCVEPPSCNLLHFFQPLSESIFAVFDGQVLVIC